MAERWQKSAIHLVMSLALCISLLQPTLGLLFPDSMSLQPLWTAAIVLLLLEALSLRRPLALGGTAAVGLLFLFWLFARGGAGRISDVAVAFSLRLGGQQAALPLVQGDASLFLAVVLGGLCWLASSERATWLPSLLLCVTVIMLLWLSGAEGFTAWLLPGLAVTLIQLIRDRHEQTNVLRLLPFIALMVLLAFLFAPSHGQTLEPLREKVDELRQAIMDRLFYTEPRDVFSLSTEGYYPQGSGQLGGKPEMSDHPVMQVSTSRATYLRGVILNEYDGHAWFNTTGGRRFLWQSPALSRQRALLFDEELPDLSSDNALLNPAHVSVRMLSDSASTLFVPQRVRRLSPGGGLVPYFSNASEIFITRNLRAGDTYAADAPLFQAGDPGIGTLIEAASLSPDPAWESNLRLYTALPTHLEQPLYDLAADLAGVGSTPYEQAFAIQSWLNRNCRYTLDVSDQPANVDFVTRFLMETREGYCTYFASAMTVLCRMAGLPARYVEGYLAEPNSQGEALVTGMNAHAWTEVYFQGFGWLTFDATPHQSTSGGQGDNSPESSEPETTPSPEPTATPEPTSPASYPPEEDSMDSQETPSPVPESPPPEKEDPSEDEGNEPTPPPQNPPEENRNKSGWPWLILLVVLLAGWIALRVYITAPSQRSKKAASEEERLDIRAQEIMDLLTGAKIPFLPGETLISFASKVDQLATFSISLLPVGETLSRFRYSLKGATEADVALLEDTAMLLRAELTASDKARYWLRRLFIPLSRRNWTRMGQKQPHEAGSSHPRR